MRINSENTLVGKGKTVHDASKRTSRLALGTIGTNINDGGRNRLVRYFLLLLSVCVCAHGCKCY